MIFMKAIQLYLILEDVYVDSQIQPIFIVFLITINFVNAKSSDLFINNTAEKIFNDCNGKNIEIKSGFFQKVIWKKARLKRRPPLER